MQEQQNSKRSRRITGILLVIGIPVLYALILRLFFGIDRWSELFNVMSVSFLLCLPAGVGALTIYYSKLEDVRSLSYRIFMPWVSVIVFFLLTCAVALEGIACWLMVLPLFLISASIAGLITGYFRLKADEKKGKMYVSLLLLLPFLTSPLEQYIGAIPGRYQANTSIIINAAPSRIWENVVRVREISPEQDKGYLTSFLGFPRPIKAELNYEGVGASREAIFSGGLVFHEKVLAYDHQRMMKFSIKANPHEIPSTTMDEHVVIGGDYFDVLDGTYELHQLGADKYELVLYSHFKLSTTFNFYAGWWAGKIMEDIQNNILQVIKRRSEAKS